MNVLKIIVLVLGVLCLASVVLSIIVTRRKK